MTKMLTNSSKMGLHLLQECHSYGFHAIIGLTGSMASGKSQALTYLRTLGAIGIDADALAHTTYVPGGLAYKPLLESFGPTILAGDGLTVDRAKLGAAVFGNPEALARLQNVVWPATAQAAAQAFIDAGEAAGALTPGSLRIGVLEAALLLEAGWADEGAEGIGLEEVWLVTPGTDPINAREEAITRAVARSGGKMSAEQAAARLDAQMPLECKLSHPAMKLKGVLIDSSGPVELTQKQLSDAWQKLVGKLSKRLQGSS